MKLVGNDELRIIEEDMYLAMGFLKGCKPIKEAKKSDKGDYKWVLDEWKDQWRAVLPKIHQVLAEMRNQRQRVIFLWETLFVCCFYSCQGTINNEGQSYCAQNFTECERS